MTEFAQTKYPGQTQIEREPNPNVPSTDDISAKGYLEVYGRSAKTEAPTLAGQDRELASRLQAELLDTRTTLESDVAKQGFIGKTYDWLKGHAGTSADSTGWFKHGWSEVLNYDDSSAAIEKKIDDTAQKVVRYSENPSAPSLMQNLQSEVQNRSDGTVGLKAESMVTRYDRSQSAGVNGIADAAILALSFTKARAVSSLLHAGLAGATTKMLLKAVDGGYSTPLDDALSGGLVGASLNASLVGRTAGDVLVAKMENNGLISSLERRTGLSTGTPISMFKSGMQFAPVGALTAVSSSYTSFRADGENRSFALAHAFDDAPKGAAQGFALGALADLIRVVPTGRSDSPLPPSPEAPLQGDQGITASGADRKLKASANDGFTPKPAPDELSSGERIVNQMSEAEKLAAAKSKMTLPSMLDHLSEVPITDVKKAVAGNANTSELTLAKLAQHPLSSIKELVAENPKTSSQTLHFLANCPDDSVRMVVARNPHSDLITLRLLRHDSNSNIRKIAYRILVEGGDLD